MEELNKSYYAIIPANVRYDDKLTPNAKLLYGEITALCNEKGYCWATNSYFAKLYKVSNKTISKWINQLINKKYIYSKIIYKENTKYIEKRYLYIGSNDMEENFPTYGTNIPYGTEEKFHTPMEEKFHTPMEEKFKENNTLLNNTSFNNTFINSIMDAWNSLPIPNIKSIKNQRLKHTKARIKEVGEEEFIKAIESINQSSFLQGKNNRGWVISYDWFVNPNNFTKVIEGKYIDKQEEKKEEQTEWHGVWDVEKDMESEW